jgi:hypothetical protein
MTARTGSCLAWILFGLVAISFAGSLVGIALITARGGTVAGESIAEAIPFLAGMFAFPLVGVLIASRHPRNPIGWLLIGIGLFWELGGGAAQVYVTWGFEVDPGSVPRPDLVAALTSSIWVPAIGLIGTFLLLLFPNGSLPTPRWRPLAWLSGLVLVAMSVLMSLAPVSLREMTGQSSLPPVANPLGVEALRPFFGGPLFALLLLLPLCMLACALSLIGRFRRSRGQERLQLKWLAAGAGTTAALYLVGMLATLFTGAWRSSGAQPEWLSALDQITPYSFVLIPVAAGISILRHRLYDIDVIINRALVYGGLTAVLALTYAAGVVGVGGLLREVGGETNNSVVVAASTLAVAALFRPARARIQAFIDRRFYRSRYDAARTIEDFSRRLRDEVTLDTVTSDLLSAVQGTFQPAHASLCLRRQTP